MRKHSKPSKAGAKRRIPPRIRLSPAVLRTATLAEINFGLRAHRDLGHLPFGFTTTSGRKIMVATASDYSFTFIAAAERFGQWTKGHQLRELNEVTLTN